MVSRRKTHPIIILLLLLLSFVFIYPFYYILVISFNDAIDANRGGIYLWPRDFSIANYEEVFKNPYLMQAFGITALRVVIAVLAVPFINALYGYAVSQRNLIFRRLFNVIPIITMYVGGGIIPLYLVLRALNLVDTFWVYVIPALYVPFYILVFRAFFQDFPSEIREAAIIDGCNEFNVFTKVIFPLSMPVLATIALFTAVGHWNDWFVAQAFILNPDLWPLQTILLQIIKSQNLSFANMSLDSVTEIATSRITPESIKLTMIIVTTIPIMIVYPFLQKYFVKGVMIGAVKE